MTNQEIFDKVYKHLLTQNARSTGGFAFGCMYRGHAGRKCAVGCLVPDERYSTHLEGHGVSHPHVLDALGFSVPVADDTMRLLDRLQRVHDLDPPEAWPIQLAAVAATFSLTVPTL